MSLTKCPARLARLTALVACVAIVVTALPASLRGQAIVQSVGGISIDAKGVVTKVTPDQLGELVRVRQQAFQPVSNDLQAPALRKVSLRKLEAALAELHEKGTPIPDEMRYLAGLQRIQYIFVYPEQQDIVIAGPGEGWRISPDGEIVGRSTNRPVLLLDDLLVALRSIESIRTSGISCSIDPTTEGLARHKAASRNFGPVRDNPKPIMQAIEESLGPQVISVTGVPETSHFARVLVAADYRMKRLAMAFEEPPIEGLPNFLDILKTARRGKGSGSAMPRWWLTMDYGALVSDPDGLAWEIRKAGVQAMTEDEFIDASGVRTRSGEASPLAKKWADNMTAHYDELSARDAIFGQLRNCMDMAVLAALISQHSLAEKAQCKMTLLVNRDLPVETYLAPQAVDTQTSVVQKGNDWIIAASGGVQINPWQVLESPATEPKLGESRAKATPPGNNWWWN